MNARSKSRPSPGRTEPGARTGRAGGGIRAYLGAVAIVGVATVLGEQVRPYLSPTNLVMAYLLAVVFVAVRLGRRPAILTVLLSVFAFDFFFVPPRFSFSIADSEFLITFVAFFTVGMVISSLVAEATDRAEALRVRELHTASLYSLSRDLIAAQDQPALLRALVANVEANLKARVAVFLPGEERLEVAASSRDLPLSSSDTEVALWSYRSRRPAGRGTDSFSTARLTFIPLRALATALGVLAIEPSGDDGEQVRRLLDSYATQLSQALERIRLSREAQQLQLHKARENLERALLNSISHDLRTPLATITGVLSTVLDGEARLNDSSRRELLENAHAEAQRMNRFVGNLLEMTRLESGAVQLNLEPCDVQDLVGCALSAVEKQAGRREIDVRLQPDLPLVEMDLVLMIQVLVNLLDNAFKHSPAGCRIEISAQYEAPTLAIAVADCGPGVPREELKKIFDKFYRIPVPEGAGGTGLGLSICRGIVEAHGGSIRAQNRAEGGLKVMIFLPVGEALEEGRHGG